MSVRMDIVLHQLSTNPKVGDAYQMGWFFSGSAELRWIPFKYLKWLCGKLPTASHVASFVLLERTNEGH